jgi:hypothetical protein
MEAVFGMFIPIGGNMGGFPHPGHPLPPPGYPSGQPVPGGGHPDQGLPGGGGGSHPSTQPIPVPPNQVWPNPPATPIIPPNPPPGSVWPPLPPGPDVPTGKALVIVYISGHGARYAVVDLAQPK